MLFSVYGAATYASPKKKAPIIQGNPSTSIIVGQDYNYIPAVNSKKKAKLIFTISNKPSWAIFSPKTGALTGMPTLADVGTTQGIVVSARVRSGKKVKTVNFPAFNLTVTNPNVNTPVPPQPTPIATPTPVVTPVPVANSLPTISGSPPVTVNVGETFNFTPNAKDADNDDLTYSITNKPAWASFSADTGALIGTPTESDVGINNAIVISVSDNKGGSASLTPFNLDVVVPVEPIVCPLMVIGEYECRVPSLGPDTKFSLNNAPLGMVIQPRSGYLHWTPSPAQQGQYTVEFVRERGTQTERATLTFTVPQITVGVAPGIYVAENGSDTADGTLAAPLATLQQAANRALPGDTIYLRGGIYRNTGYGTGFDTRTTVNLARITRSGTAAQWITIRPHGNEYVKLVSDANGIVFAGARYWRVQGLEVEGTAQSKDVEDSLRLWWKDNINEIDGRGISASKSEFIEIMGCVVYDFTGAGVNNSGSAYLTVTDNVVYNNGWWSDSGVQGVANGKPGTFDNTDTTSIKIFMERNLVYGNQSSVISRVFSKGLVKLEIDEGNGLHMQNTEGTFVGGFLIKNNLLLYNGKAGVGINVANQGVIENNSFYANSYASSPSGDIVLRQSLSSLIAKNLFHPSQDRRAIHDTKAQYAGVGINYAVPVLEPNKVPGLVQVPSVFIDPANLDFRPSANVPDGYGVDAAVLAQMEAKRLEYGLTPATAPTLVNQDYVNDLKLRILRSWPDGVQPALIFEAPETGYCYAYEDRNDYPNPPSTGTVCP
jgi:Putative Ig domain/Right handed beta helix region